MTAPDLPEKKRTPFTWLKLLVSGALLAFLFWHINITALFGEVKRTHAGLFVLALAVTIVRYVISVVRWGVLLRAKGFVLPWWNLMRAYLVSSFYNLIFPSVLGGDVVRAVMVAKPLKSKSEAASSVIVERLLGFLSLALIAMVALLVGYSLVQDTRVRLFVLLLFVGFVAGFVVLFSRRVMGLLFSVLSVVGLKGVQKKVTGFYETFYSYKARKGALVAALALSVLYQWVGIVVVYVLGRSIGIEVGFTYYLVFLPLIWVVMMVPISISGMGLREGAFVFFFGKVGVSREAALLLSLLFFSHMVIMGLIGAAMQLAPDVVHPAREPE